LRERRQRLLDSEFTEFEKKAELNEGLAQGESREVRAFQINAANLHLEGRRARVSRQGNRLTILLLLDHR
jgi:hypothetical protein